MSTKQYKNIGLIGLGIIGRRIANALAKTEFNVYVWNRTPKPYPDFSGSLAEVADLPLDL